MRVSVAVDRSWPCDHAFLEEVFAKQLPCEGIDVRIFFRGKSDEESSSHWHGSEIRVAKTRGLWGRIHIACWTIGDIIRGNTDIVFIRNSPIVGLLATICGSLKSIPVLYQISHFKAEHLLYLTDVPFARSSWRKALQTLYLHAGIVLRNVVCRRSRKVFVVSEAMQDVMVERYNIDCDRLEILPLGAPSQAGDERDVNYVEEKGGDGLKLVYAGTLCPSRKLWVFIDALKMLLNEGIQARLMFIGGDVRNNGKSVLEAHAADKGVNKYVDFTGEVARSDVYDHLQHSDIGLSHFPDHWIFRTNSPMKVMEYISMGLPVVCNYQPEQAAIVKECRAGIVVEKGNPVEYWRAIKKVAEKSWDEEGMKSCVREIRGYHVIGGKLLGTFEKVVKHGR